MAEQSRSRKRILIGAGNFADARAALAIVERLTGIHISDIGGLFLEDRGMLEAAAPRDRRVVTSRGSILVVSSQQQLRRLWQSDAKAFRERLMHVASDRSMRWTFEQQAGDTVLSLCSAAQSWDWLVIGHSSVSAHRGRVVAIPHDAGDGDVTALAGLLSRSLHTGTLVIGGAAPEAEILSQVSATHAAVVVIDAARGPFRTAEQIRRLVNAARCPVLVLGAAQIPSLIDHSTQIPPPPSDQAG